MAAYRRVYDSRHLQADCQEPGSVPFVHVTYDGGLVRHGRRSDTLCTSGFMDNVIFAHKPSLLDVAAQLKRSALAALGLAINCAQ